LKRTTQHPYFEWTEVEGKAMKVREVIEKIEKEGWYLAATRGSHRQYKHPEIPGRITIPGHMKDTLAPGTLNSILKQAGMKGER